MKNNIRITFFAILLLGIGQLSMSATTAHKAQNFNWNQAYESHYYTTGHGVFAKVKKDTDPKKKVDTGAKVSVAALKKQLQGQVNPKVPASKSSAVSSTNPPKPVKTPNKRNSVLLEAQKLPIPPTGQPGKRNATSSTPPGYEAPGSRLSGGFSKAAVPTSKVAPAPVPRPTAAQIQARDAMKRPMPTPPSQSQTASTSSTTKMTAVKSARPLAIPPKPDKKNKVKLPIAPKTAVKNVTPIQKKTAKGSARKKRNHK